MSVIVEVTSNKIEYSEVETQVTKNFEVPHRCLTVKVRDYIVGQILLGLSVSIRFLEVETG